MEKKTEKINKIRLLMIWDILQKESECNNPITTEQLREKLAKLGFESHRTTIYQDIKMLNEFGFEVMVKRGRSNAYYVEDRKFDDPEIHILMDAVQAASFIPTDKTEELVDKIASLAGSRKGEALKKNIVQFNTTKNTNKNIFYSVNEIVTAIANGKKIIFLYFDYDTDHQRVYRRDGHHYVVSPYATIFSDGHYYLLVYDKRYNKIVNYRIDRMKGVTIIDEDMDMPPAEMNFDSAKHKTQMFGMFSGNTEKVKIEMNSKLIDAVYDRFGENVKISPNGSEKIVFNAEVQISNQFFGWCCSFGLDLKLLEPRSVVEEYKKYVLEIARNL